MHRGPLNALFYAPTFEKVGGANWFAFVRPSTRLFVTLFDAYHNLGTMHARVLKLYVWISHEKVGDAYFSHQDYAPFLSNGPLQ